MITIGEEGAPPVTPPGTPELGPEQMIEPPKAAATVRNQSATIGAILAGVGAVGLLGARKALAVGALAAGIGVWRVGAAKAQSIVKEQWRQFLKS